MWQVVVAAGLLSRRCGSDSRRVVCHDRYGYSRPTVFERRACSLCYKYLFPSVWPAYVALTPDYIYLMPFTVVRAAASNWTERDPGTVGSSFNIRLSVDLTIFQFD